MLHNKELLTPNLDPS